MAKKRTKKTINKTIKEELDKLIITNEYVLSDSIAKNKKYILNEYLKPEANDYLEYYSSMQNKHNKEFLIKNRNNTELFNNSTFLYDVIINHNELFNSLLLTKLVLDPIFKYDN